MGLFGPPNVEKLKAKRNVKSLVKALRYKEDCKVRQAAAEALGQIKDIRAVDPLITALKDRDRDMRQAGVKALGQIGDARAVEPLISAIKGDKDVRQAAVKALGQIGDTHAVEALRKLFENPYIDKEVRLEAVNALSQIGISAVVPLIAALSVIEPEDIQQAAIKALSQIGNPAIPQLSTALLGDSNVCRNVAKVLDQIGWSPDKIEIGVFYLLAKDEWGKCVELGESAIAPLIAALGQSSVCGAAVKALGQMGTSVVVPLIAALNNANYDARRTAAEALGQTNDVRAIAPLNALLQDKTDFVREAVVKALGQINDVHVIPPLSVALQDQNREVRQSAVKALNQINDVRIIAPLSSALLDKDWGVREAAATQLVKMYHSGTLDSQTKQQILAQRDKIAISDHEDWHRDSPNDCTNDGHRDRIAHSVAFPL